MRLKEKNLYSAPKRPARTRLYEPTQGTAQIGSLEKSYKLSNYTAYIQKKKNENEILCVHYGRWHAHDYAKPNVAIFNIYKCIQFNTFFLLFAYFYSI